MGNKMESSIFVSVPNKGGNCSFKLTSDFICHRLYIRGATFWAFFKNHDATLLNASILHQLTLKRPSDPQKNRRRNFPKPKTSNFGPILAYVQKKAHLAILKPPSGAMIVPNFWYWA